MKHVRNATEHLVAYYIKGYSAERLPENLMMVPINTSTLFLLILTVTFNIGMTHAGVMIAKDAGLLMEHHLPASSLNQQLLNCIYRVRQCIPACLNGGRLLRPWMPWKKCHCECPPGFRGFVCQIFQPVVK
ncbi:hypothetical protein ACTXT7_013462 [Hymenolepis weldensis]